MKNKLSDKSLENQRKEKIMRFSIRKYSFGAASVAVAAFLMFLGNGAVAADQLKVTEESSSKVELAKEGGDKTENQSESKISEPKITKPELDKSQLANYIGEIEGKISSGAYANKTEESVASLAAELANAKATLASASSQEELTSAYQKLVTAVNSKLRNKPVEKKEIVSTDTTENKETVGIKAENTEKPSESNAIEKTGANDPRNGSEIEKDTTFRAAVNQDPKVDFTFSIPDEKKIYIYNEEHFSLEIPVYSETGKIRYATIKKGSRQRFPNVAGTDNDLDVEFGFTATVINRAETAGVTSEASQANPAKIVITGRPNDILKKHRDYTKQENQTLNVGTRYIQVVDDQGRENLKKGDSIADPGYFYLVLKSQAKKYALRSQPTDEKISVTSLTNPTAEDLKKIKDSIQLEYSTTNEDARFADKRGTLVEHPENVIQSVNIVGNNIVVTFTDGSTKTKPVSEIVQKNVPPVVNLPYSNEANRNIYIYSGEETDLTFTATDESKIKDLKLRGPGDINYNNATSFGLAVGNIVDSAVTSGAGSVSEDKKTATIKMTGTTNLTAGKKWTSVIVAKDDNNGESAPFNGRINATTNPAERQKIAGYVEFVVKNQTKKYDIKAPEGTVSVIDPSNVTADEFEKIKEKVKIEYSQTNDDANLTSKRGQPVDNQASRISTITKDASGNLVVTYKDGSTDTKPLSEYVSLNKQPAIDAVNKAAEDKIAEINANTNATAEEKAKAKEDAKAKADAAKQAIDNARTNAGVDQAKANGTTEVNNVNPTPVAKSTAKKAVEDALAEKIKAIEANNDLTDEEKATAKQEAQDKAAAAKQAIDNATTNAAVTQAKNDGATSVDSVNPTAVAKPTAKKAVEDALAEKIKTIEANNDLTAEEKAAAKQEAQDKAAAAKQAIDNAATNAGVEQAKANGTTEVNNVNPTPVAKPAAKKAIEDALKAKNDAIDANNDLTDEEKITAKADAEAKADAAKQAIDNATINAAVDQAKANGTTEVNNVNPTAVAKPAAKKAVEDALVDKIKAIDANNDLTDEEKTAAKADVKAKADAAKTAIDNATTNTGVEQAKANGTTEVNNVNPTPVAKPAAKKAVEDALAEKIKAIEANNDLTAEEKAAAKQEAQDKAAAAKQAIDNATTNDAVTQAKNDGATSVDNVNPTPVAKPAAKKAVEDALAEKIKTIEANNDLTAEEKAAAKQEAQDKAAAAKQAIDNATTNVGVDQAKANGTTEVNNVNPTPVAKPAAKKAVEDALAEKIKAIEANNDLTDEEKTAAKADAKAKADAAKTAIDNATTNDAVTQAKTDGATEVNNVNPTPVAKPAAKKAIDDALKAKNDAIDANNDLTDEEKTTAKADAKAKADAAKTAIDNATTNDAVTQDKNDGARSVDSVNPTPAAKPAAKKAIDDALKAKNDAIDANNDLTDEEKTAAKADAKAKADAAKQAIDNATTNAGVEQAKADGSTSVDSVNPTAQAKPAAKKVIDDALKAKNDAIDTNNDLTAEEKTKAKEDAKSKADAAKQAINNATTNAAVEQAKNAGAASVSSVIPTAQAKPAAKQAIDDALKAKNDAIDANNDLTAEEKAKAKEDAKAKADAAKTAIDNATTNAGVDQAKANGTTEVNNVNPTPVAKPTAKKAIDDALKVKNDAIDANNDLTAEEKAKAKEDAKAKADAAKQAIDNATTNAVVDQAKANGTTEVNNVNPTPVAKPAAKKAVEDALADKIKAIDANNDLTDEEKTAAKQEAQDKAAAAKTAIDNATTNAGVDQARANGTTEVNNVNPTPVAKPASKKAIEGALKAKEAAIDANNDLTAEEKATAKQEAQDKAAAAKQAIDKATTNADVENAKTTGVADVNSLNPVAVKKPEAKKAVDEALKAKEAEIDANNDLTAEEKLAAKEEAKAKADAAKQVIDEADTDIKVDVNSISGLSDVNSFSPEPVKKSEAKKAIDAALEKKIEAIDARDDLTTEEKTAAKAEAENKANEAKEAINVADTDIKVDVNSISGLSDVNSFSPEAAKKPSAKQAIDDALKAKEDAIDANDDLTAEEKAKAKAEAKAKADAAKEAIDNATTNAEVEQAKTAGTEKVDSVNPTAVKKPEAKQAIDDALKAKNDEIDARTDLTEEEKTAAKAEAKKKADAAKEAIDNATTNAEVEQAKTAGTTKVDSVNPTAIAKPEAKKAIDDALKAKNDAIDANNNLTAEEKAKAKEYAKAKADAAKEVIDNATTNVEVEQAKTVGITKVDSVNPVAVKKPEVKQAIDDALKAKTDAIDARTDLTDEEKAAAKSEAKAKADAVKEAIDKATTNAEVDQAQSTGTTEVNSINPVAIAKPEANQVIDEALKAKNDEIDARTDLTDEEKTAAKADAKAKADAAKEAIDNATTNAEVEQAKTAGTASVASVTPKPVAKPTAKQAIDDALKAKNDVIDSRTDLTDEEKAAAKSEAKAKANAAKAAIDNATTNAEVDRAKVTGITEVKAVDPQPEAKPEAKKAIDDALKAKTDEIDSRTDLTDEEKAAAKADAKAKADAAKTAIDNATTNDAVTQAKNDGAASVASVNPTAQAKPAAKQAIDDALKAKTDAIDANNDLTAEEKAKAKEDAKAKADAAKQAIDNATTNDVVTQAKNDGAASIASVNPTAQAKPAAKQAIDDALKAKTDAIDANNDLTAEEKAKAKEDAKAKADAAKQAIDNATTNDVVTQAKNDGAASVASVTPAAVVKTAAKQSIDEALKAKNDEIDARTDLTDEEKAAAKSEAKAKADAVKATIDNATTNAEVEQAKVTGTTEVTSVNPEALTKSAAKQSIDEALKAKTDEIDARTDLTDEEKTAAKGDAKTKADAAKTAIDNATTNDAVTQVKNDGAASVASVTPAAVAKTEAKQAIDEALKAKSAEIDARTDLTDEEKTVAKLDAKAKADAAKATIDNAITNAEVEQAKVTGITEVKAVDPQPEAKTAAKQAIDDALKAKNDEIDARTDLTDEEKTAAKSEAKAKADAAKEVIDKATTNAEVDQAKSTGIAEVTSVNPGAVAKTEAKQAIDEALKAKNDEIDARTDLTDEEKAAAKSEAKAKADAAKEAIDKATTNAAVDQAKTNGTLEVTSVNPEAVAKTEAKQAIDDALKAKTAEIDARTDLTDEEKTAAKADAKAKADAAKSAIDKATTNAEVYQSKSTGITAVTSVNPEAVAKTEAKQAIDEALKSKTDEIDSRTDLTDEEKTAAKAEVKDKADAAKSAIDKATKNAEVDQSKSTGITAVTSVNPEAVAKTEAKQSIDEALKAKTSEIDSRTDLTEEEKIGAKAEAKTKADAAKTAIDNATTNAEVEQAKVTGTREVNNVNPDAVAKSEAKKSIDEVLKAKTAEIDGRTDLTDEEKTAAKADAKAKADAAKAAIDKATTNATVDQAKSTGIEEVNSVNPIAQIRPAVGASAGVHVNSANPTSKEKPQEKQAIDQVLKTDEAKAKVKDSVASTISQLENENQQVATNQRVVARELPNTGTTESITAIVAATASAILGFGLIARRRKEDEEDKLENQ